MKLFIVISAVIVAAAALPALPAELALQARLPPVEIGADNLLLGNSTSRVYMPRNAGLSGFGAGTVGGAGGAVWTVWDAWALRDALNTVAPRIVYVRGRIDLTVLFESSPGVRINCGPFKTIIGGDSNAEIYGGGLKLNGQVHVIIQNLKITNCISYAPGEQPNGQGGILSQQPGQYLSIICVDIERSEFVWVDHCEFSDDPWNANSTPDDRKRHHSHIAGWIGANWISVSNNIFRNHDMNILIGHDDSGAGTDIGKLKFTFYLNWFQGTNQRNPRLRYGEVHILNNLYTDIRSYGIGMGTGAQVWAEKNVFINTGRAWANIVYNQPSANARLRNVDNWLINSSHDSGIGNSVSFEPSWYYGYSAMNPANVESHVRHYAGTW